MKRVVILLTLLIFLTSCVPDPEVLAGVSKEELNSGKAVEKVLKVNSPEIPSIEDSKQTLGEAHEKEIVDVAENEWADMRKDEPRILDDGAIEAGVGQKFKVSVS
jgi:ABC-type uncharacterized transport system auxiliary subunit